MNIKEIKELLEHSSYLAEDRTNYIYRKLEKKREYKEKSKKYNDFYNILSNKYTEEEIQKLVDLIVDLYNYENVYIYTQGLIDGVLLKEEFRYKEKND